MLPKLKQGARVRIGTPSLPPNTTPQSADEWPLRCDIASLEVNGQALLRLADYNERMVCNAKLGKISCTAFLGVSLFLLLRGLWVLSPRARFQYGPAVSAPPRDDRAF